MSRNLMTRVKQSLGALPTGTVLNLTTVLVAVAVGVSAATAVVSTRTEVGPLVFRARLQVGLPGQTTLELPPFGEMQARTHRGPARLLIELESVDVAGVQELLAEDGGDLRELVPLPGGDGGGRQATVSDLIEAQSRTVVSDLVGAALATTAVAVAISALMALALRRRAKVAVAAGLTALALVVGSIGIARATFDPAALSSPRLEGALAYVPELQAVFSAKLSTIEQLRSQAVKAAESLASYYADPRSIQTGGGLAGTYRVLHMTDLHLDPVGAEFARALARSYETSLVVNTGDIAKGGTAEEAALLPSIVITSTPVVYVPGNHDSPATLRALSAFKNHTVAETGTVSIDGFTIAASGDPASAGFSIKPDSARVRQATRELLSALRARADAGFLPPTIIALHDPAAEKSLVGSAPLILSGHSHSSRMYRHAETIRLNSGTTGGMPFDPDASGRERLPHSASILYYTTSLPRRLIAIDRISLGVDGTTTLDRTIVDESLVPDLP